ncbi:MAG: hypothetical protein E6R12_11125 [Sphingomonadales bacterium]|nr:MAG: hypothetical protein E6R12_11125 [Sphingomonadales bacterium]
MRRTPLLLVALLIGCAGHQPAATSTAAAPSIPGQAPERPGALKAELEQPPFTRDAVLKLNAIVARAKTELDSYDAKASGFRAAVTAARSAPDDKALRAKADAVRSELAGMQRRAHEALRDMKAAEAEVRTSGDYFNDVILSAMVYFVEQADKELTEAVNRLSS